MAPISSNFANKPRSSTATESKALNSTATDNCNWREADQLYEMLGDVINPDPKWRVWYCQQFMRLAREEILKRASIARADGRDRRRYFSLLLKNA